jgi:dimethylaniline monooxygenase (N-oxide forming)
MDACKYVSTTTSEIPPAFAISLFVASPRLTPSRPGPSPSEGFDPVFFERSSVLGGQWSGPEGQNGVWPNLHTNTSRVLTAFCDMPFASASVFPKNTEVHEYLETYAAQFNILERIRFSTEVRELRRSDNGWTVEYVGGAEEFQRVVIATGRFHSPTIPDVPGIDTFTGSEGVISTYSYKEPERYRGKSILVCGCAVITRYLRATER